MNGILAQTAALAAHAAVRAVDPRLAGDGAYWSAHSTFKYVKSLAFVARRRRLIRTFEETVASTVPDWLASLPEKARVELVCGGSTTSFPARISSALAGGTRDGIAVFGPAESSLWLSSWEPSGDKYPEPRIWNIRYTKVDTSHAPVSASVGDARSRLAATLTEIETFARGDRHLAEWGDTFAGATAMLASPQPVAPYHPDILPAGGFTLAARQLLAAAVSAYVFGGMGSWNDVVASTATGKVVYRRLSEQLYDAVIGGIVTAVNAGLAS